MTPNSSWSDELYGPAFTQALYNGASASPSNYASVAAPVDYSHIAAPATSLPMLPSAPNTEDEPMPTNQTVSNANGGGNGYGSGPTATAFGNGYSNFSGFGPGASGPSASPGYGSIASPAAGPSGTQQAVNDAGQVVGDASLVNRLSGGNTIPGVHAASDALNIYNGVEKGGVTGYAGAALGAADLSNTAGLTDIPGVGPASDVLGIYNGVKQGGVAGYSGAAVDAAQLYAAGSAADVAAGGAGFAGAGAAAGVSEVAGPALAIYALYQLDQHASQISPSDEIGNATRAAATQEAQGNAILSGQSHVYGGGSQAGYGEADLQAAQAELDMAQMYAGMSPAQINATMGFDNTHPVGPNDPYANAGGYGQGNTPTKTTRQN